MDDTTHPVEDTSTDISTDPAPSMEEDAWGIPQPETTEEPAESTEEATLDDTTQDEDSPTEETSDNLVEIDGRSYSMDDLKVALKDAYDKSKWQKTLTQQAQQLSERESRIEQLTQSLEGLTQKPQQQLSDEEQKTLSWLKSQGIPTKEEIEQLVSEKFSSQIENQQSKLEALMQRQAEDEILSELDGLQQKYGLSKEDANDVALYAQENNLLGENMEFVYLHMNRDKFGQLMQDQIRKDAGEKRKASAAKVGSATAPTPAPTPFRYDKDKHKTMDWSDLMAEYNSKQG